MSKLKPSIEEAILHFDEMIKEDENLGIGICAIDTLNYLIKHINAENYTYHELTEDLTQTIEKIQEKEPKSLTLQSACNLYYHFIRQESSNADLKVLVERFKKSGEVLLNTIKMSRKKIIQNSESFIRPTVRILTHGYSMVVSEILLSHKDTEITLYVTEGGCYKHGEKNNKLFDWNNGI